MSQRLGGRFVLGDRIGSGGMSTVYLGTDEVLERPVAIKVLKPEHVGSDVGARFRREGRTAARLSHPNIVQVYDAGEDELDGREVSYIVMEHVSGGDLKERVRERGPLSEKALSGIGADVAAGLAHAHERGVIHRDVKPQNVLLDEHGQPKLADFGIARALDSTQATQTGAYLGTAIYSSPEQLQGGEVTPKSDIYSLGITLYEAATGSPPFSGTPVEVIGQQLAGVLEPPRQRGASIGADLEGRIMDCLAKEPDGRPGASGLRERLLQAGASAATGPARVGAGGMIGAGGLVGILRSAREAGGRGAARTARPLGAARAASAAALRERLKRSSRVAGGRAPVGGITLPTRTFGARPNRTALLAMAAVALALIVVVVSLVAALGSGEQSGSQSAPVAAATTGTTAAATEGSTQAPVPTTRTGAGRSAGGPQLTDVAAAETVAEMYLALTRQRYSRSYELLSGDYRQSEYPSLESWMADQGDLRALRFVDTPDVKASDGEAEVKGEAEVIWSDGSVTRDKGTWKLVREDDRWKVDEIKAGKRLQGPSQGAGEDGEDGEKNGDG